MVKAVTFDLDGVYFPDGKQNFIKALGDMGIAEDEAKRVFLKSESMNLLYKEGKMTDEEFWTWAASQWHLATPWPELVHRLIEGYTADQAVRKVIRKLQQHGYKALICSNNFPARVNGLQEKLHFLDDFDTAVFSYEVGATKPSVVIFEELIRRAKLAPEEIIFADDNQRNLQGAQDTGMIVFQYEDFAKFLESLRLFGVAW
jgi:putative hydrolase of the HAD superfamily